MFPCSRHVRFHEEEEIVRINPRERSWLTGYEDYRHATTATRAKPLRPDSTDAYVHLAKSEPPKHDYTYAYPLSGDGHTPRDGKTGIGGGVVTGQPRPLTAKWLPRRVEDSRERLRCVYCQNMFSPAENRRGRCQEAPDPVQTCIRRVSFMWCADSLLYHCMSDPEGDYSDPCSCDASEERFCLRWLALLGLSLLAPLHVLLRTAASVLSLRRRVPLLRRQAQGLGVSGKTRAHLQLVKTTNEKWKNELMAAFVFFPSRWVSEGWSIFVSFTQFNCTGLAVLVCIFLFLKE